jgi:hypothetical protein
MPMSVMDIGNMVVLMLLGGMFMLMRVLPKGTQNARIGA